MWLELVKCSSCKLDQIKTQILSAVLTSLKEIDKSQIDATVLDRLDYYDLVLKEL